MKIAWHSSYEKNNYGDFFYALMRIYQPQKVVELGTKAGYSAYHIARALNDNGNGSLDCYDLWEDYQFNSVPQSVAEKNLKEFKDLISLNSGNAIGVDKKYKTVDILHVDLNNEGGILEKIIPRWIEKIRQIIIIEGGSSERDRVEWMIEYNKMPLRKWLEDFTRDRGDIEYFTIEPYPSVTIIRKL
ncbi:class I SAM-dependent methyltransferase [Candidatus Roizmanbacteria bacterium]|nr:class I SAM-dependent methyltransferase [Candidatus Roizmanbacteria bacterium]